jgi:hypothetical protein
MNEKNYSYQTSELGTLSIATGGTCAGLETKGFRRQPNAAFTVVSDSNRGGLGVADPIVQ